MKLEVNILHVTFWSAFLQLLLIIVFPEANLQDLVIASDGQHGGTAENGERAIDTENTE